MKNALKDAIKHHLGGSFLFTSQHTLPSQISLHLFLQTSSQSDLHQDALEQTLNGAQRSAVSGQ